MLRPGTAPWLLAHDLRLAWRDVAAGFGRLGRRDLTGLVLVVVGVMHAAIWTVADDFGALSGDPATREASYAVALPVVGFVLPAMLAQALAGATTLLYGRGDLDLVLSSPISPRLAFGVRALAVAAGAFGSAAIFLLPLADDGALAGHLHLLGLWPALLGGALLAAALGLTLTLGLFRVVGPRRTRLAAQILATFVGAAFVIALQLRGSLPELSPSALIAEAGWRRAILLLPVRASLGEPLALTAWLSLTAAAFAAAALLLGPAFARSTQAAAGIVASPPPSRTGSADGGAFAHGPLPVVRRKEWRLIARDPWVVSQVLLQVLYLTPLIGLIWSGGGSGPLALSPTIVVVAFQVSSSLTWLGLCGEDAPDLLASAPVPAATLRRGKLEAVGSLTFGLLALPLLGLAWLSPPAALATAALGALGSATAVALQGWHGRPGRRSAFATRHRGSKLMALIEMALSVLFGLAAALAVLGSPWTLAPLALVGGLMAWLKPSRGTADP